MSEHAEPEQPPDLGRMPKNFLASWLLLLMRNGSTYGYQLSQTLAVMGLGLVDPATVYRTLRQLEEEGMITSTWNPGPTGPARRVYMLSDLGEDYLRVWARQLEHYQSVLDRFFEIYNTRREQQNDPPQET
jgi:poly-beta-hydroxybutyrate-responsive repressor